MRAARSRGGAGAYSGACALPETLQTTRGREGAASSPLQPQLCCGRPRRHSSRRDLRRSHRGAGGRPSAQVRLGRQCLPQGVAAQDADDAEPAAPKRAANDRPQEAVSHVSLQQPTAREGCTGRALHLQRLSGLTSGAPTQDRPHQHTMLSTHASLAARKGFSHASSRHPSACLSYLALSPSILPERRATRSLGHSMPRDYPASSSSVRRKSLLVTLLTQRRDEC